MNVHPEISANPRVMAGLPCIKGTRITVANILRQVAAGRSTQAILSDYPQLTASAVRAALEFAADLSSPETHELIAS